ncbi:LodA/GoxA family CTQ-dependent oxidase [uncultured Paludibaculum sp.]|uniref:LodA/GoxA family CTQ-dependent oxidase n=1 Tax=uncultured Paludibaculum sp. TaxID=1765020 RepID=UPI002AAB2585|nr:LodA/GoxA family CTQ-dependent oxidase [uncultured Paludibaculum sp.]
MIQTIKIFPPIGIARLGNSRDGYFIGPERPDEVVTPAGGFRDGTGLKRQAARFYLFAFDENGHLVQEITSDDAEIKWTLHIANTKAADQFFHPKTAQNAPLRNAGFHDRNQLKLDPGPVSISGVNSAFADLAASRAAGNARDIEVNQLFLDQPVRFVLGAIMTDDRGRLVALGGLGESRSPVGMPLSSPGSDFADHDGWYDDVSDGRVSATVTLADGSQPRVESAWLIVAPPKYAPGLHSIVSLYDTLLQSAVDRGLMPNPVDAPNFKPSLVRDIQPILTRAANMRWVYNNGAPQFSSGAGFHHTLGQPAPAVVFGRISKPSAIAGNPGTGGSMPKMWSDLYPAGPNGTLTRIQYRMLEMWKNGTVDATPVPPDPDINPDGLTRAALDPCVGAAFFPGIEASWRIRDVFPYLEPFRLNADQLLPGDVTSQMSLPWQSDFLDCAVEPGNAGTNLVWWPAQRPIAVLKSAGSSYIRWARMSDDPASPEMSVEDMITQWHKLGFVTEQANGRFEEETRP